jgi:hypothetical protein
LCLQGGGYETEHSSELADQSSPASKPSQVSASMRYSHDIHDQTSRIYKKRQYGGGIITSFRGL